MTEADEPNLFNFRVQSCGRTSWFSEIMVETLEEVGLANAIQRAGSTSL